jgi:DNA-binding NarL/FixJ family response regulator
VQRIEICYTSVIKAQGAAMEPMIMSTVIVSASAIMESSIRSIFHSLSSVRIIGSAAGCLSALQLVREEKPDMLVIDANLPGQELKSLLQQIKQEGLATRSLVVTTTREQERRAVAAGADKVFPRYGSNDQLNAMITEFGRVDRQGTSES